MSNAFRQISDLKLLASLVVVLALAASSITTHAAVIAHWTFDESSGPTVHDGAGSFDGTLSSTGAAFVSGGIAGNALSLDRAANGFVNMGNVLGLTSGDFSIVVWLKMNTGDTSAETVVLSKHERSYHNGYLLGINSIGGGGQVDKAMFYEGSVVGAPISSTTVNDGNWHQVVAVFRAGANKSIYVDGSPAESIQASECFGGNPGPFLIGATGPDPLGNYSGLIDEVQIYSHALSDGDVDFLFQHPSQIVLDCSQQLADAQTQLVAANAMIANLQTQVAAANQNVQSLQNEILALSMPLQTLTQDFKTKFRDAQFQIPGATAAEQMQSLAGAILDLNRGQKQKLFFDLGGRKNRK